jgi:hypothetical protein
MLGIGTAAVVSGVALSACGTSGSSPGGSSAAGSSASGSPGSGTGESSDALPGPLPGTRMTDDYVRSVGRVAYLWGWPLVNMHNRRLLFDKLPGPGLIDGVVPAAKTGMLSMLHDYITPDERQVACPNQDVVYGAGTIASDLGPSVIQVPDFGNRFWVYQGVDQRTESFVQFGTMYGTKPGFYLLAPKGWTGKTPDGIQKVFTYDTKVAIVLPRVFMDNTDADRAAIQPVLNQIMMYPLSKYTGKMQTFDWSKSPTFPSGNTGSSEQETRWVDPTQFFAQLPVILDEVPARPGEEALYAWFKSLTTAAASNEHIADLLRQTAIDADGSLVTELFDFRNIGIPVANNWSTQHNGSKFGTDYLSRTAMDKANIFVNSPNETTYFYQDLDQTGQRLTGANSYSVTFPADGIPPVKGFWSLTLYNKNHFFNPNDLKRYSLGTKDHDLHYNDDKSLTLIASAHPPADPAMLPNWLPAPADEFSLYVRAYWPDQKILDGTWTPPAVRRTS